VELLNTLVIERICFGRRSGFSRDELKILWRPTLTTEN